MKVDVLEIMEIFERLPKITDPALKRAEYEKLIKLYTKDLFLTGDIYEGQGYSAALHSSYLSAVYDYIDMLKLNEEYNAIAKVCSRAKAVDEFDERLSMELMQALVNVNKGNEALKQYGYVTDLQRRYMDLDPSEEMQEFYLKMVHSSSRVRYNLDFVRAKRHVILAIWAKCLYNRFCV